MHESRTYIRSAISLLIIAVVTSPTLHADQETVVRGKQLWKHYRMALSKPELGPSQMLHVAELLEAPLNQYETAATLYYSLRNNEESSQETARRAGEGYKRCLQGIFNSIESHKYSLRAFVKQGTPFFAQRDEKSIGKTRKDVGFTVLGFAGGFCHVELPEELKGEVFPFLPAPPPSKHEDSIIGDILKRNPTLAPTEEVRGWIKLKGIQEVRAVASDPLKHYPKLNAYRDFIRRPEIDAYREEVRARLDDLEFQKASELTYHSLEALDAYLNDYPTGRHVDAARIKREEVFWQSSTGGSRPWEEYLEEYPNGRYAQEALRRIEVRDFAVAREDGTEDSLQKFLTLHPDGAHSQEGRIELERIRFESAIDDGSKRSLQGFLDQYPSSSRANQVRAALRERSAADALAVSSSHDDLRRIARIYADTRAGDTAWRKIEAEDYRKARQSEGFDALMDFANRYSGDSRASTHVSWARTRARYIEVLHSDSYEELRSFWRQYSVERSILSDDEERRLAGLLLSEAKSRNDFDALVSIFDDYRTASILDDLKKLVQSKHQEAALVSRMPTSFFRLGSGKMGTEYSGAAISLLLNQTKTAKPKVSLPVRSAAQHGTYYVEAVITVKLTFRKEYSGLLARDRIEYETKTVTTGASVVLGPGGSGTFHFELPKVTGFDETGAKIVAKVVTRFVEDDSKIESVEFTKASLR